jgi:hypothetical protein
VTSRSLCSQGLKTNAIRSSRSPTSFRFRRFPSPMTSSPILKLRNFRLWTRWHRHRWIASSMGHGVHHPRWWCPYQQSLLHLFRLITLTRRIRPCARTPAMLHMRSEPDLDSLSSLMSFLNHFGAAKLNIHSFYLSVFLPLCIHTLTCWMVQ